MLLMELCKYEIGEHDVQNILNLGLVPHLLKHNVLTKTVASCRFLLIKAICMQVLK
jgi:hypothetical protein